MAKKPSLGVSGTSSPSKSLMWMMVALFIGLAGLLGIGLFVASRAVRTIGLSVASASDTIKTPGGSFRLQKEAEVGPGLPIYPRSSLIVPDEVAAAASIKLAQKGIEVSAYHSSDTRDFVDEWYAKHLSPEFTRHDPGEKTASTIYSDAQISDNDITFVVEREQILRMVVLSADSAGTKISLIRSSRLGTGSAPSSSPDTPATPSTSTPEQNSPPAQ